MDGVGSTTNSFANAKNVGEVIDLLAAGAALRESGTLGPEGVELVAAQAKQRLFELGVQNFG